MMDTDTFLTTLYVMADDFCKYQLPPEKTPGPKPSLTRSEVVTLALFGQWSCFLSERGFYRYARHHLRPAFPTLPYRGQFNRLMRRHYEAIIAFFAIWRPGSSPRIVPTKPWTALGFLPEMPSVEALVGWRVRPTSAGATAWVGTKGSICWSRLIPRESSLGSVLPQPAPKTSPWPRTSSPSAMIPSRGGLQ